MIEILTVMVVVEMIPGHEVAGLLKSCRGVVFVLVFAPLHWYWY